MTNTLPDQQHQHAQPETESRPQTRLYMLSDPESPQWKAAEAVEAQNFIKRGYVESAEELAEEYRPYLPQTTMAAVEVNGEVVGAVRFITYDPEIGFKTIHDIESGRLVADEQGKQILAGIDPSKYVEIGTIAVDEDFRRNPNNELEVTSQLYGIIKTFGESHDAPDLMASFDEKYFNRFITLMGPSVRTLGPPIDYMGSNTIPAVLNLEQAYHFIAESGLDTVIADIDGVVGRIETVE